MLEFFPMEGEHQVGFVEVPIEFENWLIAVSGISFEDVSLNVLGEEDGEVELIMEYDDYMNLCDLYYEYDTLGWMMRMATVIVCFVIVDIGWRIMMLGL